MGLFTKLKELFNKNIDCGEDMNNHIVFFLNKKKYLYLNKNIIVRDGTSCVVVYKKRVCDIILAGKYKINEQSIPQTYAKAKIEKQNKKGSKVKRIRADLYFVNINEVKNFNFDSDESFMIKSREAGRLKGFFQGMCNLRVIDAGLLVRSLIAETGVEKTKDVPKDIGLWIGNKINKKIQKDKIPVDMIFGNHERLNSMLNSDLEDAYDNIGIYVKNIRLKAINFPKKYQKKINTYLVSHKKLVYTSNINNANWQVGQNNYSTVIKNGQVSSESTNNTMQKSQNNLNLNNFKTCDKCGFKNQYGAIRCRNCNTKY